MKKIFLIPFVLILCSCGAKNQRTACELPETPPESGQEQARGHNEENEKPDILRTPFLTLEINGKTIKIPGRMPDFQKAGWRLEYEPVGESIMKGEESNIIAATALTNDHGETMLARFSNKTRKDIPLKDCLIIDLVSFYTDNKPLAFVLPGGITGGTSTEEDVLRIYGKPDKIIDGYDRMVEDEDTQKRLGYYSLAENGWVNIYIAAAGPYEGKVVNFDIRWQTKETEYE